MNYDYSIWLWHGSVGVSLRMMWMWCEMWNLYKQWLIWDRPAGPWKECKHQHIGGDLNDKITEEAKAQLDSVYKDTMSELSFTLGHFADIYFWWTLAAYSLFKPNLPPSPSPDAESESRPKVCGKLNPNPQRRQRSNLAMGRSCWSATWMSSKTLQL